VGQIGTDRLGLRARKALVVGVEDVTQGHAGVGANVEAGLVGASRVSNGEYDPSVGGDGDSQRGVGRDCDNVLGEITGEFPGKSLVGIGVVDGIENAATDKETQR